MAKNGKGNSLKVSPKAAEQYTALKTGHWDDLPEQSARDLARYRERLRKNGYGHSGHHGAARWPVSRPT